MNRRRRFNRSERIALYLKSRGRCAVCGKVLDFAWHADHIVPVARGGRTTLANGQALCPECNLGKGEYMHSDQVKLRLPQVEAATVYEKGARAIVLYMETGSGKGLTQLHLNNLHFRETGNAAGLHIAPRRALCKGQAEGWNGDEDGKKRGFRDLYADPRIGHYEWVDNNYPVLNGRRLNFSITAQQLVRRPHLWLDFVKEFEPALFLDEAQFYGSTKLGREDAEGSLATKSGDIILQMLEHASLVVWSTATPVRIGNTMIVGLEDRYEVIGAGANWTDYRLDWDVRSTYIDGLLGHAASGTPRYLIPFDAEFFDGSMLRREVGEEEAELFVASKMRKGSLKDLLTDSRYWHPFCDNYMDRLRQVKRIHQAFRGVIAAYNQDHARAIYKHLKHQYSSYRIALAISDNEESAEMLDDFRNGLYDVLVTVRMVYIGFDCPEVMLLGALHGIRWEPFNRQFFGRGVRVSDLVNYEQQMVRYLGPPYPQFREHVYALRAEQDEAIRIWDSQPPPPPAPPKLYDVEDVRPGDHTLVGANELRDVESPRDMRLLEAIYARHPTEVPRGMFVESLRIAGVPFEQAAHNAGVNLDAVAQGELGTEAGLGHKPEVKKRDDYKEQIRNKALHADRRLQDIRFPSRSKHGEVWADGDSYALCKGIMGKGTPNCDSDELAVMARWYQEVWQPHVNRIIAAYREKAIVPRWSDFDRALSNKIAEEFRSLSGRA